MSTTIDGPRMCDYFGCLSPADLVTDDDAKICAAHYKVHVGWTTP